MTRIRVLMVEDSLREPWHVERELAGERDPVNRDICFRVHRAPRLGHALRELHRWPPDAILVDPRLPDATGTEAIEHLRHAVPKGTAILVISGLYDCRAAREARLCGADGHLTKWRADGPVIARSILSAMERC